MDNIQCKVNIDNENKKISLQGLTQTALQIGYNGDVDFTELVSTLAGLIDDSKVINFTRPEGETDEKLKLIIDTISDIICRYNESAKNNEQPSEALILEDIPPQ